LYDYFSFLEANDLRWDEVPPSGVPSHLAHYRNWSVQTGNRASTINQRLRTVNRVPHARLGVKVHGREPTELFVSSYGNPFSARPSGPTRS
jgi:hypothetical protein